MYGPYRNFKFYYKPHLQELVFSFSFSFFFGEEGTKLARSKTTSTSSSRRIKFSSFPTHKFAFVKKDLLICADVFNCFLGLELYILSNHNKWFGFVATEL